MPDEVLEHAMLRTRCAALAMGELLCGNVPMNGWHHLHVLYIGEGKGQGGAFLACG